MALNYGQTATVAIKFLNSWDSPMQITSLHFLEIISESVALKIPQLYSESMRGLFDEGDSYEGAKVIEGDVEIEAEPIALGTVLAATMGVPSSTLANSVYTHVFEPRLIDHSIESANHPIAYFKNLDQESIDKFGSLNAHAFELSVAAGEFLKCKCSVVGGSRLVEPTSDWTAVYPTGRKFRWNQTSISVGGAARADMVSLSIKVEDGIEAVHTLNASHLPSRITRQSFRNISIEATMKFDTRSEYDEFKNQSERELIATWVGDTVIGDNSAVNQLTVKVPKMRYEEYEPIANAAGQIEVSMTGRAKYSVESATALQFTLVNTLASWY